MHIYMNILQNAVECIEKNYILSSSLRAALCLDFVRADHLLPFLKLKHGLAKPDIGPTGPRMKI